MRARLLTLPVLLVLACQSSPPPALRAPAAPSARTEAFDAQRAWQDLGVLAEIGPRVMATEGARRAGDFILGELADLDLQVFEQEISVKRGEEGEAPIELRNIAAKIPGSADGFFLLVAPYDTRRYESFRFLGVNDGGSGAALLLEIARVLAVDPLPYTTWVVFLEGEAPLSPDDGPVAPPSQFGSRALVKQLEQEQLLSAIRLAVILNRVCDADLHVARDLLSHRIYREEFWRAAARLGRSDAFSPGASFESPAASHQPLVAAGLQRVVALVDTSFGGDEPPGLYAGTEDDDLEHCSAESLETVGKVTLEALDTISQRLARIDRFAHSPLAGPTELTFESPESPAAGDAATLAAGDEAAAPQEAAEAATPQTQTGDDGVTSREAGDAVTPPAGDDTVTPSSPEGVGEPPEASAGVQPANAEAQETPP